jgi:predicted P-loop ATPase
MKTTLFGRITQTKNGSNQLLDDILNGIQNGKWQDLCLKIATEKDKEKRQELKKTVPYFTPSGIFDNRRNDGLIEHSGFIAIDIDDIDNIEAVERILRVDDYTYALFRSISGNGLCVLVKIDKAKHRDAFDALQVYYFDLLKLPIDNACKDVARARFVSYDPSLFKNTSSKVFKKYLPKKETKIPKPKNFIHTTTKFERVMSKIDRDITGDYQQWVRIGFAIASEFGEGGRDYFRHVSSYSTLYDSDICDKQYNFCCREYTKGISIQTFYYYAKQAGIEVSDPTEDFITKTAYYAKTGGRNKESVKKILEMNDVQVDEEVIDAVFKAKDFNPTQNENGKSELNIDEVEIWLNSNYNIKKNEVTEAYENEGIEMTEEDFNSIYIQAKKTFEKLSREIFNYVVFSNFTPKYNPIKNYINGLDWDKKDRISDLCKVITSDTGDVNFRHTMLKKWLVGIIEAIYSNKANQLMLVLGGKKNTGKSYFFENLLPKSLERYMVNDFIKADKDALLIYCNNILFFNDEFENDDKNIATIKKLLSARYFDVRAPYSKKSIKRKKIASFCAATNETQILNDPTGNRRIIFFEITDKMNWTLYEKIDKSQLFAQMLSLYEAGETSQLTIQEIEHLEEITGEKHKEASIEAELLFEYVEKTESNLYFKTTTLIKDHLETVSKQKLSVKKLGMELKRLGYERVRSGSVWGYKCLFKNTIENNYNQMDASKNDEKNDDLPF